MNDETEIYNDLDENAGDTTAIDRNRWEQEHPQQHGRHRQSFPTEGDQYQQQHQRDNANDQLEKCGRWLASIPRDEIAVLRNTVEYQEFLGAFERLGHAHLRVIVNNNHQQRMEPPPTPTLEDEDSGMFPQHKTVLLNNEKRKRSSHEISKRESQEEEDFAEGFTSVAEGGERRDIYAETPRSNPSWRNNNSSQTSTSATIQRASLQGNNHFLRFTDDILLRILEFLRCKCMIQASLTCSRFRQLVTQSAIQRTYEISKTRQLGNVMQLLRAKEQIYHAQPEMSINDHDDDMVEDTTTTNNNLSDVDCSVPVPMLLPRRKVVVTNSGDPEYDGVYYCTDCNGNGFVFTKPRFSSPNFHQQIVAQQQQQQLQHQQPQGMILDEGNQRPNNNNNIQRAGLLPLANHNDQQQQQQHRAVTRFSEGHTEESSRSGLPLRCFIAKAYSNHEVLWYMSKEIENESLPTNNANTTTSTIQRQQQQRQRPRIYSFWAPLMLSGNAPKELCVYPSQTSALVRQNQHWNCLRSTTGLQAPTLEILTNGN